MDAKYHYSKSNRVRSNKIQNYWSPCFANHYGCEWYELPLAMSKEDATKWLELLQKDIEFKWEFSEFASEDTVRIYPPRSTRAFLIFFGNLTKGVSEAAWFCEQHLKDKSKKGFFVKSWEAFKAMAHKKMGINYNQGHIWFLYGDDMHEAFPRKSKTLKEAMEKLEKVEKENGYSVWPTIL